MYDCVIIGKGPAGITSGIYLKRAGYNCIIIGKDGGNLVKSKEIENYYGINKISGEELLLKGIQQAQNLDIEVITDEVIEIENKEHFIIKTINKNYEAKTIILATGNTRKKPNINGLKEFEGKGISYCAICDGFFFKNKEIVVIGNGNYAINEINHLLPITKKITLLTNGEEIKDKNIKVNIDNRKIKEFIGDKKLQEINFIDNTNMKIDGAFIAIGTATSTDLVQRLGVILKNERIIVDEKMQTNIKGLYAAGDCTGGLLQISKAIYQGAQAGISVMEYLKLNKKEE